MNGEDSASIASSDDMPQTMMEIDYETVIDDDAVDEFAIFKGLLEGTYISCFYYSTRYYFYMFTYTNC